MFQSTKNDDNDQVGGLGLGCKSPFAYLITAGLGNPAASGAGSFNVTSYQSGIANFYVMSLASDGRPKWAQIGAAPTSERDGLEVSFAVRQGDRSRFEEAARNILWSFNPRPKINLNPTWEEPVIARSAPGWTQYTDDSVPFDGPIVRMGCVSYPIDPSALTLHDWPWSNTPIMFEANIGSLSVQASRESLSYDQRTIDTLTQCLRKFEIDYIAGLQVEVDAHPTYLDAVKWWFSQPNPSLMRYLANQVLYRGTQPLKCTYKYSYHDMRATYFTGSSTVFEPKPRDSTTASIDLTTLSERKILIEYRKGRSQEKFDAAWVAGDMKPDETRLWLRPASHEVGTQFLAAVGLTSTDVILLDSYPLSKIVRSPSSPKKRGELVKGRLLTIDQNTLDIGDVRSHEVDAGGVYAVWSTGGRHRNQLRNRSIHIGDKTGYLSSIQSWFRTADITDKQEILLVDYLVRGWTSFRDWFLPILEAKIDFTQPIYAPKKGHAPAMMHDVAKTFASTPNLPQDVAELIELITTTNVGFTSTLNKLYPIYQEVGGTRTPPAVIDTQDHEAKLFAAFRKKYPMSSIYIEAMERPWEHQHIVGVSNYDVIRAALAVEAVKYFNSI
jgi:hypothetical protein